MLCRTIREEVVPVAAKAAFSNRRFFCTLEEAAEKVVLALEKLRQGLKPVSYFRSATA
jgi:hypothetical protein